MSKKLLLLGVSMLSFATSFAQSWERPLVTDFKFADEMKSTLQANSPYWEGDSTIYYLYNVDADAFLTNTTCSSHAQWATHAAVRLDQANPVMMAQYRLNPVITTDTTYTEEVVEEEDSTYTKQVMHIDTTNIEIIPWDGVTYKLLDLYNGAWRGVFPDNSYAMFVDRGSQADYMWNVKSMGNGVYRIHVSDLNPKVNSHLADSLFGNPETYMGFNFVDPDYNADDNPPVMPLTPMLSITGKAYNPSPAEGFEKLEEATLAVDWKFMPQAEYNKWKSLTRAWDFIANGDLDQFIDETENDYASAINTSKLKTLRDSATPVTYEEIQAEINVVKKAIRDYKIATIFVGASDDNPVDATELLVNPDLEAGNITGWTTNYPSGTVTNLGYQSASYTNGSVSINKFIEAWSNSNYANDPAGKRTLGNGSVYQLVEGLPAGKYSFSCDAIASRQDEANQSLEKGAYLYARSGDKYFKTSIHTNNNAPEHFEITFINVGGDIEFGFMTEKTTVNWIGTDNFRLVYYGEVGDDDPYKIILDATIADCEKTYPDLDNLMADQKVKDAYQELLDASKEVTDEYEKADSLLKAMKATLASSVADYVRLEGYMKEIETKANDFEHSDFPGLGGLLGDYFEIVNEAYLDREADKVMIDTVLTHMGHIIVEYITANVKPGDELTPLISNPDYNKDFSGWSNTGSRPAFGGKGGNADNAIGDVPRLDSGNAEVFQKAFNMFQIIRNMPKGAFKLTAQAFERLGSNNYATWAERPEKGITTVLYANDFEQKIPNIMEGAQDAIVYQKADTDGWPSDTYVSESNQYVPNSMDGANFYFNISPETYKVEVDFALAEAGDSITVGLKTSSTSSWVIFDNFRLFYIGEDLTEPIKSLAANLNKYPEAADFLIGNDAIDQNKKAVEGLEKALASSDLEEGFAALKAGNEARKYSEKSAAAYAALNNAYEPLMEKYSSYEKSELPEELVTSCDQLINDVENAINGLNASAEEVIALNDRIKEMMAALKMPNGGIFDLTKEDFFAWSSAEKDPVKGANVGCDLNLNTSTGMVYGESSVGYLHFADLSGSQYLELVATAGTPRCLFNRIVHEGTVQVEVPRDASYWTVVDNGDGSKTYTVDTKRIMDEYGYVHLHAIKGANWQNTTVTSLKVAWPATSLPDAIESIETSKAAIAGIYNLNGQKRTSLSKGINIVVDKDGKTQKLFVK